MDGDIQGVVKWFNESKGFGFIDCKGRDYFVHFKSIMTPGFKTLKEGQRVNFKIGTSAKGPVAENVVPVD